MNKVVIDSNVLVAILDARDKWHPQANVLIDDLAAKKGIPLVYFDCVLNETISVLARRLEEQKRSKELLSLLDKLQAHIPADVVVWVSADMRRLYPEIIQLIKQTSGKLNFHDALMVLKCRELGIETVATFDEDFDLVDWVKRMPSTF